MSLFADIAPAGGQLPSVWLDRAAVKKMVDRINVLDAMPEPSSQQTKMDFAHVGGDGEFTGYAYIWDVEYQGMTIARGAFEQSLTERWPKLLWDHDPAHPVGKWLEIVEDDKGLRVKGQLDMNTEKGRELASLMAQRAVDGLSISFTEQAVDGQSGKSPLARVALWEISLCTFPAIEPAVVDSRDVKPVELSDTLTVDATSVRRTSDGYLVADARAARTGIQLYNGRELGRPDLGTVRVYRPEAEVFSRDSLKSYGHKPLTNDHPPEPVTPKNSRQYAVGHLDGEVVRDGEFVRVQLMMTDEATIKDFESGKRELSLGYKTVLDWTPGKTPSGEAYDCSQKEIRANHLALVKRARGGEDLRIGDHDSNKEPPMNTRSIFKVDGVDVEMNDTVSQIVARALSDRDTAVAGLTRQLADAKAAVEKTEKELEEEKAKAKKTNDELTVKLATAEAALKDAAVTPEKLSALVKDRQMVIDTAKRLFPAVVVDGKTDLDIRKQVVAHRLGDSAKNLTNDDQIKIAFDTAAAMVPASTAPGGHAPVQDAFAAQLTDHQLGGIAKEVADAYTAYDADVSNGWKTKAA